MIVGMLETLHGSPRKAFDVDFQLEQNERDTDVNDILHVHGEVWLLTLAYLLHR